MTTAQSARLYLFTPPLREGDLGAFAPTFSAALEGGAIACALARLAPGAEGDAKKIIARLVEIAAPAGTALLVDNDARLAARAGADGAHINWGGSALSDALASLKPERIVGAGSLRSRDDAMNAGEAGADYVMFGEPRRDGFTPAAAETVDRIGWWAEIFEPPCVGYARALDDIAPLIDAGADFIALGEAIWGAPEPIKALNQARAVIAREPS